MEPSTEKIASILGRLMALTSAGDLTWKDAGKDAHDRTAYRSERNGWAYYVASDIPFSNPSKVVGMSIGPKYGLRITGPGGNAVDVEPSPVIGTLYGLISRRGPSVLDEALAALS